MKESPYSWFIQASRPTCSIDSDPMAYMRDASLSFAEGSTYRELAQAAISLRTEDINEKVLSFEPSLKDIIFTVPNGRQARKIYYNQELEEHEIRGLEEFKAWIKENNKPLPMGMIDEHNFPLRFLSDNNYNNQFAYDRLLANDKWMKEEMLPMFKNPEKVIKTINKGYIYSYGRDKSMRPVWIVNLRKMFDSGFTNDEFWDAQNFLQAYLKFAGMVPGKIEQYVIICDGRNISLWELPTMAMINLAAYSIIYFKHFSHGIHIIGLPWIVLKGVRWTLNYMDDF